MHRIQANIRLKMQSLLQSLQERVTRLLHGIRALRAELLARKPSLQAGKPSSMILSMTLAMPILQAKRPTINRTQANIRLKTLSHLQSRQEMVIRLLHGIRALYAELSKFKQLRQAGKLSIILLHMNLTVGRILHRTLTHIL